MNGRTVQFPVEMEPRQGSAYALENIVQVLLLKLNRVPSKLARLGRTGRSGHRALQLAVMALRQDTGHV